MIGWHGRYRGRKKPLRGKPQIALSDETQRSNSKSYSPQSESHTKQQRAATSGLFESMEPQRGDSRHVITEHQTKSPGMHTARKKRTSSPQQDTSLLRSSNRRIHDPNCIGWYLYFPNEEFSIDFPYLRRIKALAEFFIGTPELFMQDMESGYVNVNYQDIAAHFEGEMHGFKIPFPF